MRSIWTETVSLPEFPSQDRDIKTDVLIIGGGICGILCAYMLSKAGVDCVLVEAKRLCSGVTGLTTAKITSQHGFIYGKLIREFGAEKALKYLQANQDALERYRSICADIDCDFQSCDNYVYSLDNRAKAEKELAALNTLGFGAEFAGELPLPFPVAGAVKFPGQARFNPLKFLAAIVPGLRIFENTKARGFSRGTVLTDRGVIRADSIIAATHFPIINKHGGYFIKLYQHRSYVLALKGAPELPGMYVDEAEGGLSFRNQDGLLLFGGGSHRTGKSGGGWRQLSALAAEYYPGAEELGRWATQDCMSLDGAPYIGEYSKNTPGLYVASGFNKWGMTGSMTAARLLTDLITGKDNPWADVFSPSRSVLRPQLALNAFESVVNLLTPTSPRCPHMGCALKWNAQERSWDCPCHGSRFTSAGQLTDNPATDDLSKK